MDRYLKKFNDFSDIVEEVLDGKTDPEEALVVAEDCIRYMLIEIKLLHVCGNCAAYGDDDLNEPDFCRKMVGEPWMGCKFDTAWKRRATPR